MNPEAFKPLIKSPLKFPVKSPLKSALRLPLGASTESSLKSPLAVQGIISNIVEDSARSYYPHFEGTKYNMYVDCRGNVTIGNGFFLDRAMAMTLRFKRPDGSYIKHKNQAKPDEPDETGEIGRDYDAVRTGHEGTLTIDGSTVIKLFEESIAKATNGARTRFPLYDTFPADARLAIHSYIFATGHLDPIIPNTKKKGEPYLHAAIMRQDWWSASAEVHMADETRGNPGLRPRNDANRRAFAYAGRVVHWNYDSKQLYLTVDPEWGATAKNTAVNANFLYLMAKGGNMIIYGWDTDAVGTQSPDVYNLGSLASRITGAFSGGCNGYCCDPVGHLIRQWKPHTGNLYLIINNDKYVVWNEPTNQLLYSDDPRPVSDFGLPDEFSQRIDTVVRGRGYYYDANHQYHDYQNKLYFFSHTDTNPPIGKYFTYDLDLDVEVRQPKDLGAWRLPNGWETGIDAAVNGEGPYINRLYMFKGEYVVGYDWTKSPANWRPLTGCVDNNNDAILRIVDVWPEIQNNFGTKSIIGAFNAGITC